MTKKRTTVFEVFCNRRARWQWRERSANGEIACVAQSYSTKWAAKRAALRKVAQTPGSTWTFVTH